jgi:hypothetical protein
MQTPYDAFIIGFVKTAEGRGVAPSVSLQAVVAIAYTRANCMEKTAEGEFWPQLWDHLQSSFTAKEPNPYQLLTRFGLGALGGLGINYLTGNRRPGMGALLGGGLSMAAPYMVNFARGMINPLSAMTPEQQKAFTAMPKPQQEAVNTFISNVPWWQRYGNRGCQSVTCREACRDDSMG